MTTRVKGQNYSPRFDGDDHALLPPYDESFDGTDQFNSIRTLFLDSTNAMVKIYNRKDRAIYALEGKAVDTIEAKLNGTPVRENQGEFQQESIFRARVTGKGYVEATWTPGSGLPQKARR